MVKKQQEQHIIGYYEIVHFPEFNNIEERAKIDTGAYTGALHCTKIREIEGPKGKVLHFSPFDHPEIELTAAEYAVRHVRSSNGTGQDRFFINTEIIIRGNTYPIVLSLADRSDMKWPVLIGRKFLRQNNFLVDVRQGSQYRGQRKGRLQT
jgi:hypothetical protein